MNWALVDKTTNIVLNIIIPPKNPGDYTCPDNTTLRQINDWVNIGDNADAENPYEQTEQ